MAWGFRVTCQDCRHEWEGIEASWHIGPSLCIDPGNSQSFLCPRCYLRVHLPRLIARATWRCGMKSTWLRNNQYLLFSEQS